MLWTSWWPLRPGSVSGTRSGLLDSESQLGSGSVALRLRVDGPEGQVDAWAPVVVLLRHLMLEHKCLW